MYEPHADDILIASEIKTRADLLGPGAQAGTIPTDLEQATGQERLEILGKIEGVDIFDMRPLDASRKGGKPAGAGNGKQYAGAAIADLTLRNC